MTKDGGQCPLYVLNIESFHRWHWVVIGIVCGAAVAGGRLLAISDRQIGGPEFVSQAKFEGDLRQPAVMGHARLKNIVIHPTRELDLVSFSEWDNDAQVYRERWFAAPRPYKGLRDAAAPPSGYSVADFLAAENSGIAIRTAWWETPAGAMAIGMIGGAVVIGGAWPFVLNFLVGAGLGRKYKEEPYDLSRFKSEAEAEKTSEMSEEEKRKLEELEAEMMAGLGSSVDRGQEGQRAGGREGEGKRVLVEEEVAAAPASVQEPKDFAGEYYPVEKNVPHGFTLVELIIVIGIIALLLGILLPMISRVRGQSLQTKCASNLRGIGQGLEMYNQVNRRLPLVATPQGLNDALTAIKVSGIMICPADASGNYGYSMNGAFAGMAKSAGDPSDMLASETAARHNGSSNVLYFDGRVEAK